MVLGLSFAANGVLADNGSNQPNFGFVPNSWEASVSKVNLETFEEVARYYTAPREDGDPDVRSWRTNRIAMDMDGNGWVLNTGTDAHQYGPSAGLQGQLVRIQADTEDLGATHQYPDSVLDFGTDNAVQVFDVGEVDDMPRAIAVDGDGYIWVGFYGSGELRQYAYNDEDEELNLVSGPHTPDGATINYYEIKFAPDGDLFISSRSSTPTVSGDFGIWRFDGDQFHYEQDFNSPYALLIADDGTVYATSYNDQLRIRDGSGSWSQVTISGARNLRGMALDGLEEESLWIADTDGHSGGNRVYWYELSTEDSGYVTLEDSTTPIGVGRDAAGLMWAVSRNDNSINGFIEAINAEDKEVVGSIEVGPRPYAYGDFVVPEPPEELTVTKSVETSYNRTHDWSIEKRVETDNNLFWDGDGESSKIWLYEDGSGDETATWYVDVNYEGYEDDEFNVSGTITIENNGEADAVITSVVDQLAGTEISILWDNNENFEFPYTLPAGETLTGIYDENVDEAIEGDNLVTVITERDEYTGEEEIIWSDPDQENYAEITVEDVSDLLGIETLGTLNAADFENENFGEFSYDREFVWSDYDEVGPHFYDNTATIVETDQSASAKLVVNWEEPEEKCYADETAWAYGGSYANENLEYVNGNNWGWTNGPLSEGSYEWDIYAGAGRNDLDSGEIVGTLYVEYEDGSVTVTYDLDSGHYLSETHLWIGNEPLPMVSRGRRGQVHTNAPGQFPYGISHDFEGGELESSWTITEDGFDGDIYVAAHSVVQMEVECPEVTVNSGTNPAGRRR